MILQINTKVNIQLTDFDISEFIGTSTGCDDDNGTKNVSPGSAGGVMGVNCGKSDTVYNLQGVVSHSGNLHGVRIIHT